MITLPAHVALSSVRVNTQYAFQLPTNLEIQSYHMDKDRKYFTDNKSLLIASHCVT